VTDEAESNVPEDSRSAIDSAWETFRLARRRRHELHEVVRGLWGQRMPDDFDDRLGDATGRII
jgi:hypothetical protein